MIEDVWKVLERYKSLEDKVFQLKAMARQNHKHGHDMVSSIQEAEEELDNLRVWIKFNFDEIKKE